MPKLHFFHESDQLVTYPSYDAAMETRKAKIGEDSTGANSALGLWVFAVGVPPFIGVDEPRFGKYLYSVEVEVEIPQAVGEITLQELARIHQANPTDTAIYEIMRAEYAAKGIKFLRVIEQDGTAPTNVILNFDCIIGWTRRYRETDI